VWGIKTKEIASRSRDENVISFVSVFFSPSLGAKLEI